MNKIIEWVIKNRVAVVFALAVLAVASVFAYFQTPKDVFPSAEFPRIQVQVDIGFASLSDTDVKVTRPLEEALKTVPDVESVRSVTERGASTIDVYFKWGTDMRQALQYVQTKISEARSQLPADASVQAIRMTPSAYPFCEYGFWNRGGDTRALYSSLRYEIVPALVGIDGIYGLTLIGGDVPEIWVRLDAGRLAFYNIDARAVGDAISKANGMSFIGNINAGGRTYFGMSGNIYTNARRLGGIVVATRMGSPVYLKDVAFVGQGSEPRRRMVRVNGIDAAIIDISKQEGADSLNISSRADKILADICPRLGLSWAKWDLSDFIQSSIGGILLDIALAVVIILFIVFAILAKLRYSLPVILVLPLVVAVEFLLLKLMGQTVNIMTLGGISAAIGIVADNAIVVTENYARSRAAGEKDPLASSVAAIFPIMLSATLVTVAVFLPLNMLSGTVGLFFKPLSMTLASTIVLSLIVAVTAIPILLSYFTSRAPAGGEKEMLVFRWLRKGYNRLLGFCLRRRAVVVIAAGAAIALGSAAFFGIPNGFLPEWDEGMIVLDYVTPQGSSLAGSDEETALIEKILAAEPDIALYVKKIGTHMGTPFAAANVGEIVIRLKKDRKKSTFALMKELGGKIEKTAPDINADFHQILPDRLNDLTGTGKPVSINVLGSEFGEVYAAAETIRDKISSIRGLEGVLIDMPEPEEEVWVSVNQPNAFLLGLSVDEISEYPLLAAYGSVVSAIPLGVQTIPVRMAFDRNFKIGELEAVPVFTPNGGWVPLEKVASVSMVTQSTELHHKNGSILVSVTSEISGRPLGDAVSDIRKALATFTNDRVAVELSGNYESQQSSFTGLLAVLAVAVVIILALLLFIFESYRTAMAVFIGTLASAAFVIMGLFITRTQFDVSSFAGMITVMGLVVNNGILVIHFAEKFHFGGKGLDESVREAGELRFRPVLITNLAAIAGFLPMAFNIGRGGEILQPFSIAMVSGLVASMFLSLAVMPVLYGIFHGRSEDRSQKS